ncbi:MAG: outer membrane protein [Xanthobacteraceae bacterium]
MNKLTIGSVMLLLTGTTISALGADMPLKAAPPPPAFTWAGCYAGINGGWVGTRDRSTTGPAGNYINAPGVLPPPNLGGTGDFPASIARLTVTDTATGSGWEGGGQFGCNWQLAPIWAVGVEVDGQWSDTTTTIDRAFGAFPNPGNPAFTNQARTEHVSEHLQWFSTARLRGGVTFDRVWLYVTGGLALAGVQSETAVLFGTGVGAPVYNGARHFGSDNVLRAGPVVGAGFEWAFLPNISVKAEYLYMYLNDFEYLSPLTGAVPAFSNGYAWRTNVQSQVQVARVGLNVKLW